MNYNYGPYKKYKSSPLGSKGNADGGYIDFNDKSIPEYLNGGMPISYTQAARMTSLNSKLVGTGITSFEELPLFESIRTIGYGNMFTDCKNLVSIYLPWSIIEIDPMAFKGCSSLVIVANAGKWGIGSTAITEHVSKELFRIY